MAHGFILIPGRTSKQGTSLNEGKLTAAYIHETETILMNPDDLQRLGLQSGSMVQLHSAHGSVTVPVEAAKSGELPTGVLFIAYGHVSSQLMGGDTHGTGMPDSKGLDVELTVATAAPSGLE